MKLLVDKDKNIIQRNREIINFLASEGRQKKEYKTLLKSSEVILTHVLKIPRISLVIMDPNGLCV